MSEPLKITLAREWFMWAVETAINRAVDQHGDPARLVGWTVRQEFDRILPRDYSSYEPLRDSDRSGGADETAQTGSAVGESAGRKASPK